jgi:hypothetical protein
MSDSSALQDAVDKAQDKVESQSITAVGANGDSTVLSLIVDAASKAINVAGNGPNKIQVPQ